MITVKVWLIVMIGYAHTGGLGAIQPFMFPTLAACEQVRRNTNGGWPRWQCIETEILVHK